MNENAFKERMRARRLSLGLSQEELAAKIKSSKQVISTYETGARIPKVEMADNIARALNVSLDYLMGNTDVEEPTTHTEQKKPATGISSNELSKEELEIIMGYRAANDDVKEIIHRIVRPE